MRLCLALDDAATIYSIVRKHFADQPFLLLHMAVKQPPTRRNFHFFSGSHDCACHPGVGDPVND